MTTITHETGFEIEIDELNHPPVNDPGQNNIEPEISKGRSLSTFLRVFGACAVIASLSMFLIEGWTDGNDLARYIKLLAQTGLITAAGIFLSFVIKEVKGARVFFGLGLASATAHFTILGALAYSMIQLDGALGDYPSMLQWEAVSMGQFLPLAIGAIALLSLLARFSFSIFARHAAGKLTVTFLLLNALLLVPVREAIYVSILAAIALFIATQVTLSIVKSKELLMTKESKYALACLFLPGAIIVSRALGLYAVDEMVLLTLLSLTYYALRSAGQIIAQTASAQKLLSGLQYLAGLTVAALLVSLLPEQFNALSALIFSIVVIAVSVDQLTLQTQAGTNMPHSIMTASSLLLMVINVVASAASPLILVKVLGLMSMIGLLVVLNTFAKNVKDLRVSMLLTITGIAIIGLTLLVSLVTLFQVGAWVLIGGLGISLIVIASLYERFGLTFKLPLRTQDA